MKWLIKNPAPLDDRQQKWGDFHFGRSLSAALRRLGHEVETDYQPQWQNGKQSDVVLVLRGKYPYDRDSGAANRDALHVMWNISHPSAVTADEYRAYDRVFIASEQRARELEPQLPGRVHALLQCTDTEQFHPGAESGESTRRDIVFVGNTRSERRDLVVEAARAGIPLKLWGRGWRDHGLADRLVAEYTENETLGALYRAARVCLNDHWPDMRSAGFINNRIFDALACGLPVLSDQHPAIEQVFDQNAVVQTSLENLKNTTARLLMRYPRHLQAAHEAAETIRKHHSFDARASELIAHLE